MRSEEVRAIHDLRIPAQMMTGCAQMLKCVLDEGDEAARRYAELLLQNGAELVSLLNQLLQASRRAADEPQLHPTVGDMAAAAARLCAQAEPYARTMGLTLICVRPPRPVITAFDADGFSRILMNLLSNAVKFTPSGGRVVVRLERAAEEICLSVTDTGIGIPDHEVQSLFTGEGAGGIGLSIVRQLAQLHGGRVSACRNLHGGMCFQVTFPGNAGVFNEHFSEKQEEHLHFSEKQLASGAEMD